MKRLKMYVREEDLTEHEKETGFVSFRRLFDKLFTDAILCNDITKLFYADINGTYQEPELELGSDYNEEEDYYEDIYQYFIVDFSSWTYLKMEDFKEQLGQEFILYYLPELDLYIVGITHLGTSWDYVETNIKYTNNLNEADL